MLTIAIPAALSSKERRKRSSASRITEAFAAPFVVDGNEVSLSTSTGIALTSDPDIDIEELMGDADLAMYAAKQGGGGRHALFGHDLGARVAPPSRS
jgi:predicted signal transduction protein with EAL and GGDEF domain